MASTSTSPSRLSLTPPRMSSRQPRPLPAELIGRPFNATSTRRDLTTSFTCLRVAFRLLDDVPVLHEQASRLAQRAVDVLGATSATLERVELNEAAGASKVMARTHEYSPNGKGADTVFRIQSLMIDLQAFANDYTSTCTKDRLRLLLHDIPATHAALATLNKSLLSAVTFYQLALSTVTWEFEDALDRETDLAALPRLFRVAIALRGPVYDEFLLEQPAAPDAGRRRDEFIEWALAKNEHLRPKDGTTPVRAWTLPSPPVSPQNAAPARTPSAVPYRYGPTGRRPDSVVSNSSKSSLLPSPVMSRSTSTPLSAAVNPPSPASDASSFPDSPTAPYSSARKGSVTTIDEDLVTPSAPGSPTASFSALSQASSYQSHLFPLPNGDKDSVEENYPPSPPLSLEQNTSEEVLVPVVEAPGAEAPGVEDVENLRVEKPTNETLFTTCEAGDLVSEPAEMLSVEAPPLVATEPVAAATSTPVEFAPPAASPESTATRNEAPEVVKDVEESSPPVAEFISPVEKLSPLETTPAIEQVEPVVEENTPSALEDVDTTVEEPPAPGPVESVAPLPMLASPAAPKDVEEKRLSVRIPPILTLRPATPLDGAEDSRPSSPTRSVRVLCLDGGGIRGLPLLLTLRSALASLAPTSTSPCPKPCEQFDLITGVGTGGLIAILLGRLRLSLDDAIELYICIAEMAFRGKDRTATRSRWSKLFGSSGGDSEGRDANLVRALKAYLPEAPMLDDDDHSPCSTAVLAFQNGKPRWLRSGDDDDRDALTVQQVARATLASSPFFRPFHPTPTVTFTETGTSPNPSEATIDEVRRSFGPGARIACFLSLGIGKVSLSAGKDGSKGAKPSKTRSKSLRFVAELEVQGSRAAERFRGRARKEGFEDQLLRYSVDIGKVDPGVDEWAALKPMAAAVDGWMRTSHSLGSSSPLWRGLAGERLGLGTTRSKKSRSGVRRSMSVGNLVDGSGMFLHHSTGSTGSLV